MVTYGCVCVWLLCLLINWNKAYVIQLQLTINAVWLLGILTCTSPAASARNTLQRKCVQSNVFPVLPTTCVLTIDIYVKKQISVSLFFN
jgi:hypothetical protein